LLKSLLTYGKKCSKIIPEYNMKNETSINPPSIAIIGSGYWGKNLVRIFHDLGVLRLICDKNESILADFKNKYPNLETCLAFGDVLNHADIDGIVISTPAETHFNLAREAILSRKHVFVEKPMALSEDEGRELIALAKERKRILMVGHLLQHHPAFICLKERALSGELGRINYIYSHRLNLGKIRREENILWSFAPHDISMILSLAGEQPESVLTTGGNYLHQKIPDVTVTHLEFPSGLRAHVFVSWLHPFKEQKLVVVGTRKMAVFNDTNPWEEKLLIYPHEINWQNNLPVPTKYEAEKVDIPQDEPLRLECQHFLECMNNGKQPITDGHEGLNVLRVLNAGQRSIDLFGERICFNDTSTREIESGGRTVISSIPYKERADIQDIFLHSTSIRDEEVKIGAGTKIWHFSHILSGSKIGKNCNIGQNVVIGPDVSIGNGCKIQNNVSVYKGVTLEDGVFCGPSMVFTNIINPRAEIRKMDQVRPTRVKKGATIGANATIVCGVTLGRYCFVGAGAVVNKDIKDHALVVGNPAKQNGWACECGERLTDGLQCRVCGKKYEKTKNGINEKGLPETE
jgi:UDP-2-acetamido-3-amino-2,3-dideoxy-glucuronate N-acetyltransferase